MYDSQTETAPSKALYDTAGQSCRMPSGQFRVNFQPCNDFEKGLGVSVIVDGVLCTSLQAAESLVVKRVQDLFKEWTVQVSKM